MTLYEAIFKRRSIRKYKKDRISEQLLQQITMFCRRAVPLEEEIRVKTEILDNTEGNLSIKGLWKVEAPYYLVLFSEEKRGYERNAGYLLEQIVLYMAARGIGSCYLGGSRAGVSEPEGMKQVIMIAFGYPDGLLYRDPTTAKRLSFKDLCVFKEDVDDSVKTILKAARLSPSAMNSQPWRFIVYQNKIYVFLCRDLFSLPSLSVMREISLGIMISHLMLAAEEMWMELHLEIEAQISKKTYKSGEYAVTALLKA